MDARHEEVWWLGRVRAYVLSRRGWRSSALAFVCGGLSALAFAPMFLSPVLFFTLPVFVWLIDDSATAKRAASAGWWFGFGYFFFNLFWIGQAFLVEADKFAWLLPFAITLLPAVLALFWAAAAALARALWPAGAARILVFAIAIAGAEWLRGHVLTGFPWNLVGYALTYPLPMMQSAALFGAYGLTLLALAIFPAPLVLLAGHRSRPSLRDYAMAIAAAAVPLLALAAYGGIRLQTPVSFVEGVNMRIVQPSVQQKQKWMAAYQRQIFDDHIRLSLTSPSGESDSLAGITHLVWPEAAMPFFPLEHPEALDIIAHVIPTGTSLITGALRHDPASAGTPPAMRQAFNSIIVLDEEAKLQATYDKIKLVPGGEFIPYENTFALIGVHRLTQDRGFFTAGPTPRPLLKIPGMPPALGLVCYEALFPGSIVEGTGRPGVLINVTNDGWFGDSTGPYQHFHQARVRAVEEGLPLVRAANNGISAVVDPYGRLEAYIGLDVRAAVDSKLPQAAAPTPYARFGDWIFAGLVLLFVIAISVIRKTHR